MKNGESMTTTESKRAEYMRGDLTFSEYYGLLVELLGETPLRSALPRKRDGSLRTPDEWRALLAQDQHLNNVPLRLWDGADYYVRSLATNVGRAAREPITGSPGWSLSDSVCVLKETARRFAKEAYDG